VIQAAIATVTVADRLEDHITASRFNRDRNGIVSGIGPKGNAVCP
jgi:hypothetical protein